MLPAGTVPCPDLENDSESVFQKHPGLDLQVETLLLLLLERLIISWRARRQNNYKIDNLCVRMMLHPKLSAFVEIYATDRGIGMAILCTTHTNPGLMRLGLANGTESRNTG
jgi:hypothetical protein